MLRRIWQWLVQLFRRLFGGGTSSQSSSYRNRNNSASSRSREGMSAQEAPPPLADSDYEYLFRQLLEGIAHRWQQERVVQWFEALKGRITYGEWVAWLRRFGDRVLASPTPNNELGMRLAILGEQLQSTPSLQEIGYVAYDIGRQLLNRDSSSAVVWEYEGPDVEAVAPPPNQISQEQESLQIFPAYEGGTLGSEGEEQTSEESAAVETITLEELLERMEQDPYLVQMLAQQLGIETNDPQVIIQELINQFNGAGQSQPE